jgi:hypothetical protein
LENRLGDSESGKLLLDGKLVAAGIIMAYDFKEGKGVAFALKRLWKLVTTGITIMAYVFKGGKGAVFALKKKSLWKLVTAGITNNSIRFQGG